MIYFIAYNKIKLNFDKINIYFLYKHQLQKNKDGYKNQFRLKRWLYRI